MSTPRPRPVIQRCSNNHYVESPKGVSQCPVCPRGKPCTGTFKPLKVPAPK